MQQSPLRDSNKLMRKVKPINLVHITPYHDNKAIKLNIRN